MPYLLHEWLNVIVRWTHVFAGILWIGQTYYFTWLDARLSDPKEEGQVWMVHSGGFYAVAKQKSPAAGRTLHWFKWEAAMTWLSGIILLVLVYYMGGLMLAAGDSRLTLGQAIAVSIGLLPLAWLVYDALWQSPLARSYTLAAVISYLLLVATTWGLIQILSARAAYMHVGVIMGTLMAANVWMRILPAQRRLVATAREGSEPDQALATRAKLRSKHNTYMVIPVVFIMLSSHFPVATYGHRYNWLILAGLILAGWVAAHIIRKH
ncbi:MAG TPA: urate hydroxylase PuuD [Thermoanaerobaculia bacterium]|nr:urate hydroxylase PuuD [Thermoanaerobaculia bacterium]